MDFLTPFLNWLITCPYIRNNKIFLNSLKAQDNNIQIVTQQVSRAQSKHYIDGSHLHTVIFTVFDYKSPSFNALVTAMLENNENVADLLDSGEIISWVEAQRKAGNLPQYSGNLECCDIYTEYLTPSTPTTDNSGTQPLSRFSIPIVCEVYENG